MREEILSFQSGGLQLTGVLTLADGAPTASRGVVLVHGWGGYRIGTHALHQPALGCCSIPSVQLPRQCLGAAASTLLDVRRGAAKACSNPVALRGHGGIEPTRAPRRQVTKEPRGLPQGGDSNALEVTAGPQLLPANRQLLFKATGLERGGFRSFRTAEP